MPTSPFDVIIIGAGIIGASCAAAAARAGSRVLVLDRGPVANLTSSKGMGHVMVLPESDAQYALSSYSRTLWHRLSSELPPDAEFTACGTLWLARTDDDMPAVVRRFERLRTLGAQVELLSSKRLAFAEPNLAPGLAGALHVPGDCVVFPPRVAEHLLRDAQERGAHVMLGGGFRVVSIDDRTVRLECGLTFHAPAVVLATGVLTPDLLPSVAVRRRKGHIVVAQPKRPFCYHQLIEIGYIDGAHASDADSVAFNVQPRPGSAAVGGLESISDGGSSAGPILIGSSRQFDFETDEVEPEIVERMLGRAALFMPDVREQRIVQTRVGFRPAPPSRPAAGSPAPADSLPVIGPVPSRPGLFVATGHEGLGITMSLGTGRLIADMVRGERPAIPVEPYSPARFMDQAPAKL